VHPQQQEVSVKPRSPTWIVRRALVLSLPLLVISSIALAQEEAEEVPARETAAEAQARQTGETSKQLAALQPSAPVTFEQVMADPDNIDLNFRYAQSQVARGDVKGAAATLERLLLIDPNLTRVRLFYGIVLFRLDNVEEAERTLREVRKQPMPASLQAEIDEYLRAIQRRKRLTRATASLSLGYEFDTNRNASPSSKRRLLADTPIAVGSGTNRKRRDTSFLSIHNVTIHQDLGLQGGHEVFASFDHYLQEQTAIDDLDLMANTVRLGGLLKLDWARVTPSVSFEHLTLSRETFLRTPGLALDLERPLNRRVNLFGSGGWDHEGYEAITENLSAPERKGDNLWIGGGADVVLTPTMRLTGSLSHNNKDAKAEYNSYKGYTLTGVHTWIWPKGQFFITSLGWTRDEYDAPDTAISAIQRKDHQVRFRMTYGVPMSVVAGRVEALQMAFKDLTATASYEQFHADSLITNYSYSNSKFLMLLTKTLEF
jgi:tetratricopeptide (TPR) repeat protein